MTFIFIFHSRGCPRASAVSGVNLPLAGGPSLNRPRGTEAAAVARSFQLLVEAEARPSFAGLVGRIVDAMNHLHILPLRETVYGAERDRDVIWLSQLRLFALRHRLAPVYSGLIFMSLLSHIFLYVSEGTCGVCMCVLTLRRDNKSHTSTGHIFQVCLTHLKC